MSEHAAPVGGPLFTKPLRGLTALFLLGAVLILWRLFAGLGATTALSDGYPWGLWIAFDVVTGTALACGGYAVALLVYILNKGKYHPMVRPALLTSALGYTMAGVSIALDVGRPWVTWKVPLYFWHWNLNSALLEVALCIMAYIVVLWIELSPALLERWKDEAPWPILTTVARRALPILDRFLPWIIALGLLLPTMHQSSLGSLMILAGKKVHPLWSTPLLPLLFLVSCLAMGYAVVVFESTLANRVFKRPRETEMLAGLSKVMVPYLLGFVALRLGDLALLGNVKSFAFDFYGLLFFVEIALFLAPVVLLAKEERRRDGATLFRAAMLLMLAGSLYRLDTYLVAFRPGVGWSYFPSLAEMGVTAGLVALELIGYLVVVKLFPILGSGASRPAAAPTS